MTIATAYAHRAYAESLSEFGAPQLLPRCEGRVLARPIPGTPYRDAMGSYPIFACRDWSQLADDIENLGEDLVSLVLVADPFRDYTEKNLRHTFNDLFMPFKEHFVAH